MIPNLDISLLGNFNIRYDEKPLTGINTPRLQSLIAYLILHKDAPQSRAHVAFLFWPDTNESQARTNLRNLLHALRHALPYTEQFIEVGMHTLQWRSDFPCSSDVTDFHDALARARLAQQKADLAAARLALEHAIEIYNGDLLPSCYDDWIIPQRERLSQAFLDAMDQLVRMLEAQRDYQAAIINAQRLLRHDPLNETVYRSLIRLHALVGDRASALRVYHTCATVFRRELNIEPSASTREAYEHLMGPELHIAPPRLVIAYSPLVGRDKEWALLLQTWRFIVATAQPHAVIACGEAGIGKTRLVEELIQWAARQGITTASARCYAGEGELAYAPVITWLRSLPWVTLEDNWLAEVARLLPEIFHQRPDLPKPGALTETWQRQRLFEALSYAVLSQKQPILLAIDDLQWCDRDTLEWVHFLLRFKSDARLMVVGGYRPEEIGESHPLVALLETLRTQEQVTELDLQSLDKHATTTLASQVSGEQISSENAFILYKETEGNPLFVVETIRAGLLNHHKPDPERPVFPLEGDPSLPPRVLSVLEARLAQLSPKARELACLAATIGREFGFGLLSRASNCDEDMLVRELDELWKRRIIREHSVSAYDFSHDKLREVAYSGMSAARRQILHLHVAQALEALHSAELDPISLQLAIHYERAGMAGKAIPHYQRAAQAARNVYSNEEAISLLKHGLSLSHELEQTSGKLMGELGAPLSEELGDILEIRAQHEDALRAYQNAQSWVPPSDHLTQARLWRKEGAVVREQRLYTNALELLQQAENVLGEEPGKDNYLWWDEWYAVQVERVWARYWLAQWPEMEELVKKVQTEMQQRGNPINRLRFLWASCLMHLRRERYVVSDELLAEAREGLLLCKEWGALKSRLEFTFELGFLLLWRRELDEAEEELQAALKLAETSGILQIQTLSLTYLTVLNRFRRLDDEVMSYSQQALQVAEVAQMPDYVAAAMGNQAWVAWRAQDLPAAEHKSQEALEIWRQSPLVYPFQWQALWPLIGVFMLHGQENEALAHAQALLAPTQQLLPDKLNTLLTKIIQATERVRGEEIMCDLRQAMEVAQEMGYL